MTRQDKVGWAKSLLILIAGCVEAYAFHVQSTRLRIIWSVIDIAFCLVLVRTVDLLFKRQRALGK